jgi:hypothetical protein
MRWAAVYGAAAVACGLETAERGDRRADLVVAAVAVAWAIWWVVSDQLGGEPMHYGPSWGPLAKEGMREVMGLSIVAGAMLGFAAWRPESEKAREG